MDGNDNVDSNFSHSEIEPDIGLGSNHHNRPERISNRSSRRDEGGVSFRQFLQRDMPEGAPDLYRCARQERLLDNSQNMQCDSPDLPDFVQDHLIGENLHSNSPNNEFHSDVLPDFTHPQPRDRGFCQDNLPQSVSDIQTQQSHNSAVSRIAQLPFDLTNNAHGADRQRRRFDDAHDASVPNARLPDFLFDSHVLDLNNSNDNENRIENGGRNRNEIVDDNLSPFDITRLRQENEDLRQRVNILQQSLNERDGRIAELQDIVIALDTSNMQISASTAPNIETPSRSIQYTRRNQYEGTFQNKVDADNVAKIEKGDSNVRKDITDEIKNMTCSSEQMAKDLLQMIQAVRGMLEKNNTCESDQADENDVNKS